MFIVILFVQRKVIIIYYHFNLPIVIKNSMSPDSFTSNF